MLKYLIKKLIPDNENVRNPKVRAAYGKLCAVYGIFLNVILFAGKLFAGIVTGSVAISADAFNNLSDAGSSAISFLGFIIASKKPDPSHPFGHGRVEYLSGMVISAFILVMGFELAKSSVGKIINPQPIQGGLLPVIILVVSIAVKLYMSVYNKKLGTKIESAAMTATAADSRSDAISTGVVLLSTLVSWFLGFNIDGWTGLAVSVLILYAGYNSMKDTVSPLLGKAPDHELVESIAKEVMSHPEIKGIHDVIVHDYGPGRLIISLHAEVDGHSDIYEIHDVIDRCEMELKEKYGCLTTIHMDPIESDNKELYELKKSIECEIKEAIDEGISIHDFRMVPGPTHTNVIFDAVFPPDYEMTDDDAKKKIEEIVSNNHENTFAVVSIDRSFV